MAFSATLGYLRLRALILLKTLALYKPWTCTYLLTFLLTYIIMQVRHLQIIDIT